MMVFARVHEYGSQRAVYDLEMENVLPHIDLSGLSAHPEIEGNKQEICPAKTIQ
jgi:hypothetical protein